MQSFHFLPPLLPPDYLQTLNPSRINDLHSNRLAGLERQGYSAPECLYLLFINLRLQVLGQCCPAFFCPCHWEEYLRREQAPAIVIGTQHPHGTVAFASAFHCS